MFDRYRRAVYLSAFAAGALSALLGCPALAGAPPAAPPLRVRAGGLDEPLASLAAQLAAVRDPLRQCVLTSGHRPSVLAGLAVRVLELHLARRGALVRVVRDVPAGLTDMPPEGLPACFVAQIARFSPTLFVRCSVTRRTDGSGLLTANVYDARTGTHLRQLSCPLVLSDDLQALWEAKPRTMERSHREWVTLLERMFSPIVPAQADPSRQLAQAQALHLMDQGSWAAAGARFLALADSAPSPDFMRAVTCLELADQGSAADVALREALKRHPDSGPLYALNSWLHLRRGRPADALPLLEQARRSDLTREALYWYAHGLIEAERGEAGTAEQDFTRAARKLPQLLLAQMRLARVHRNKGQLDEAVACYQRAAALGDATAETWAEMAATLQAADRTGEAIQAWHKAFEMRTDSVVIIRNLTDLLAVEGGHNESLETLHKAAQLNPCRPELQTAYGDGAARMWRLADAEGAYRRAMALDPDYSDARVRLAATLQTQRRYGEAKVLLTELVAVRPGCQSARIQLARLLGELGHTAEALRLLEEASKSSGYEASARLAAVAVLLGSALPDRNERAVRAAQKAVVARAGAVTFAALSKALLTGGRSQQARAAALSALEKDPRSEVARLAQARALDATDEQGKARDLVVRILERNPYSFEALKLVGAFHLADGRFRECADCWDRALKLNPWDADLHESLANVLAEELKAKAKATAHHNRCRELRDLRDKAAL